MNIFKKVGLLFKARKVLSEVKKMDKNKWFEREWLMSVAGIIGTVWAMLEGFLPKETSVKILGAILAIYVASRTILKGLEILAKLTKSTKDDEWIAKISAALDIMGEKLPKSGDTTGNTTTVVVTPPAS